jgi:hypothetical protein
MVMVRLGSILLGLAAVTAARGDEFERIEGAALFGIPRNPDATAHARLTLGEIDALPSLLRETRSALVFVTTDQGNAARMLVVPALRKAARQEDEPIPVLVLERFDTFDASNPANRLVHGKDLVVFDGFQVDLDSGQVVPEGQGGDLQFRQGGAAGPRLEAIGKAKLFTLKKLPMGDANAPRRPSSGRMVVPGDFNGRYQLYANGQWSGRLDLKVDAEGEVSGRFRSDLNGTAYAVQGKVAPELPQKITFRVQFPRTHQDYEGLLWTEGKGAMAGTLTMLDRAYGFFAIREGGKIAPEGEELGPLLKDTSPPGRRSVTVRKGQYSLDGKPQTDQELTDALRRALAAEPASWVLIQVPEDEPFSAVNKACEAISAAGIRTIRFGPADP